jgi:hypothetical protein
MGRDRPTDRRCLYRAPDGRWAGATCRDVKPGAVGMIAEVRPDPGTGLAPMRDVLECDHAEPDRPCWLRRE